MKRLFLLAVTIMLLLIKVSAQTVPAKDALKHTGKKVTICDKVYGVKITDNKKEAALYLGGDYPNQLVTVIAIGDDQVNAKNRSEADYKGKDICVTGIIVNNKGKAQITVTEPKQVRYILIDGPVKQKF
jgi:hypothetical protein